jgi:hypothetical protein
MREGWKQQVAGIMWQSGYFRTSDTGRAALAQPFISPVLTLLEGPGADEGVQRL